MLVKIWFRKTLGDFEIIRPIGRGAMGVVYLAKQISLKRTVALKVLRYSVSGKQATARFEREAELVATLQHPNIVPIYATGKHDNHHFLAMQLIDGPSLSQWIAAEDADRDPITIAKWGAEVARALAHAHQRDVIHRDVKPSNLLQDEDQKIWLTDFGLARRFDDLRMSMTGAMLGTPNYMSPEQASPARHPIDHRTDIYSLGATLFELLTGRCVFLAETPHAVLAQVLAEEAPLLRDILPDASRDLETILMKCLEKGPSDRYQTADQLADDLEAFADGRSIKARRPSLIEQGIRWKQHNQKAVSWAMAAAASAVTVLVMCIASWIAWTNSQLGYLQIVSDEGPIIGKLIDYKGDATPTFTIPTQQLMPVKEGRYTLQTWASGKLGTNQDLFVESGTARRIDTKLSHDAVFAERTVEGIPAVLPLGDRDDLILFQEGGITRVDGRTGKDLWSASGGNAGGRFGSLSSKWWAFKHLQVFNDHCLPAVTHDFPDINQDGVSDIMIGSHGHAVLKAYNGKSGGTLWTYEAEKPIDEDAGSDDGAKDDSEPFGWSDDFNKSGVLYTPRSIGDIDGDGVHDFATTFFFKSHSAKPVHRWLDVVSGKTGQQIWRFEMPEKWFDLGLHNVPPFIGIQARSNPKLLIPWRSIFIPAKQESEPGLLVLVCGTKLIVIDAKTGKAAKFNQDKHLELGFMPALTPRLVRSGVESEAPIGVLLCEQVSPADTSTVTKPVTRFSMWSLETAKEMWHYDSACDPGWTGVAPDWPLVADLTGDSTPEILIADGADLENSIGSGATCLASLQALDARTGKPVWNKHDVARIRNQDRQVQRVLLGPDADGDHREDVYVVSPMFVRGHWIFVDILSAATGKLIRSTKSDASVIGPDYHEINLASPRFLGVGADGHPRLVVATKRDDLFGRGWASTLLLSTGTGKVSHAGHQLEYPLLADADGDGNSDLFLIKPHSIQALGETAQLISLKSLGGRERKFADQKSIPTDDVDGDGVRDLLTFPPDLRYGKKGTPQALSGATGKQLWQWEYNSRTNIQPLNNDVDGDQINDFYLEEPSDSPGQQSLTLTLISGHRGRVLWQKELPPNIGKSYWYGLRCEDMNGDGENDVVVIHLFQDAQGGSLRLSCLDGKSGVEQWDSQLALAVARPEKELDQASQIIDVDNDGSLEFCYQHIASDGSIVMTTWNGQSGEVLWQQTARASVEQNSLQPIWRTKVLATCAAQRKQIVTVTAEWRDKVTVNFYDFDNQTQPVSSWSSEVHLEDRPYNIVSNLPGLLDGIPFEISDGEKRYTGVCVRDERVDKWQIVVLDSSPAQAIEVQRIDLPESFEELDNFLIVDANQDGRTDIIFHDGTYLIAIDLIRNEEVNRKPMPANFARQLTAINHEPSLIQLTHATLNREENRLKLIDPESFDVVWDVYVPRQDYAIGFDGLLSGGQPDATNLYAAIPRLLVDDKLSTSLLTATAVEYMGKDATIKQRIAQAAAQPVDFAASDFRDPRMFASLPWSSDTTTENMSDRIMRIGTNTLLIVFGALIFPFFYVRYLVLRKRWSLQSFLLLPLLFLIPYIALQLPLGVGSDSLAATLARDNGWPLWTEKLLIASMAIPAMVFVTALIKHLWNGNWKRLLWLLIATIVISIVIGGLMLRAEMNQLSTGTRYDWYDWGNLNLILYGSWFAGLGIVGIWILFPTVRLITRLARRIFGRAKLATA